MVVQLNGDGNGNFDIASVIAKAFQATLTGNGNLDVGNVYTDVLTIVQTGNGATTIRDGSAKLGSVVCSGIGDMTLGRRLDNVTRVSTGLGKVYIAAQ